MSTLCETTCAAIGRYYESLGKPYDALFSKFCEDNGLDDDEDLRTEMDEEPSDNQLVDFDKNFPFKTTKPANKAAQDKTIHELIQKCMDNPDVSFGPSGTSIPDFNELGPELFQLEPSALDDIKKLYRKQCKELHKDAWDTDQCFLRILASGKKHGFEYMLHLVDDYSRWRVRNPEKKHNTVVWSRNHRHFRQLESVTIDGKSYTQLATSAVESFSKRVCPKLMWSTVSKIDDDMETIIHYINDAVDWVHLLATDRFSKDTICPFQVDFCMVLGPPINTEVKDAMESGDTDDIKAKDDEPDDEDDEQDEEKDGDVGDIEKRLKANNLRYHKGEYQPDKNRRIFQDMFKDFATKHQLKGTKNASYLHKKRLITMVDRRKSKKDGDKPDDIWMYEPPADCQNITNDTVPEWYINSSATCLCPKSDTRASFGATTHCKRGTLTLSFHVKEERIIKCYLFWNGQMMRFFPDDIKSVLPGLFNPKKQGKRDKAEEELLDAMIKEMKEKLVDEEFDEFVSSYK
eukprot:219538_1